LSGYLYQRKRITKGRRKHGKMGGKIFTKFQKPSEKGLKWGGDLNLL